MNGYTTQQSGRWYAVVDGRPVGKRSFHRADSEEAAKKLLTRLLGQVEAGTYTPPSKMTFLEFAFGFLEDQKPRLAPNTWQQYEWALRRHICPAIGMTKLTALHPKQLQALLTALSQELSPKSVYLCFITLRRVLNVAVKYGDLRENPLKRIDSPPAPRSERQVWTAQQAATFLASLHRHRLRAFYQVLLGMGLRRGEACGLKREDIFLERMAVVVRRSWGPDPTDGGRHKLREVKGGHARIVAMSPATADILAEHLAWQELNGGSPDGFLFIGKTGRPLHTGALDRMHKTLCAQAGVPHITIHDLRHTYSTAWLEKGLGHKSLQEQLGHHDPDVTLRVYAHVSEDFRRDSAASLDDWFKPGK